MLSWCIVLGGITGALMTGQCSPLSFSAAYIALFLNLGFWKKPLGSQFFRVSDWTRTESSRSSPVKFITTWGTEQCPSAVKSVRGRIKRPRALRERQRVHGAQLGNHILSRLTCLRIMMGADHTSISAWMILVYGRDHGQMNSLLL